MKNQVDMNKCSHSKQKKNNAHHNRVNSFQTPTHEKQTHHFLKYSGKKKSHHNYHQLRTVKQMAASKAKQKRIRLVHPSQMNCRDVKLPNLHHYSTIDNDDRRKESHSQDAFILAPDRWSSFGWKYRKVFENSYFNHPNKKNSMGLSSYNVLKNIGHERNASFDTTYGKHFASIQNRSIYDDEDLDGKDPLLSFQSVSLDHRVSRDSKIRANQSSLGTHGSLISNNAEAQKNNHKFYRPSTENDFRNNSHFDQLQKSVRASNESSPVPEKERNEYIPTGFFNLHPFKRKVFKDSNNKVESIKSDPISSRIHTYTQAGLLLSPPTFEKAHIEDNNWRMWGGRIITNAPKIFARPKNDVTQWQEAFLKEP